MAAVWTRTRAELRRRLGATLWLMLFLGVAGGAVLGALAGARRTDTAYPRMREETEAGDALISVERTGLLGYYQDVAELPGVKDTGAVAGSDLFVHEATTPGAGRREVNGSLSALLPLDETVLNRVMRPVIATGRVPDPREPNEGFANRFLAGEGVKAGTTLQAQVIVFDPATEESRPAGETITIEIVGSGVFTNEVVPTAVLDSFPTIFLTPAFFETYIEPTQADGSQGAVGFDGMVVRLDPGTNVDAFRRSADALIDRHPETGGRFYFTSEADRTPIVQRSIRPQVVALQLFAALTAATALLLVGQSVTRRLYADSSDYATLRALGMTRLQLAVVGLIRGGLVGLGGAAIAIGLAIGLSPLMPLGPARIAEPSPGLSIDGPLLALGGLGLVVVLLLAILVPVLRLARGRWQRGAAEEAVIRRSPRLSGLLSGVGAPTPMTAGVQMAVDPGRGVTSAPVRSATAGTILAVLALTATMTFGASLDRLIDTPRLFGQTWDLTVDAGFATFEPEPAIEALNASGDVESFSGGVHAEAIIDDLTVTTVGLDSIKGAVYPTMLEGRPPRNDGEIVLGTATLRKLGKSVGDAVEMRPAGSAGAGGARSLRIVGRAVFPLFGKGSFSPTGLGNGALTTVSVLPPSAGPPGYNFFVLRLRNDDPASIERVQGSVTARVPDCAAGFCFVQRTIRPGDVASYARVRSTPLVLAGLLSLLAAAATVHALVTSVHRRGRDLAIFKTVGFLRRQVSATVAWQATTMMVISLLVGIPAGVAAGRAIWNGFAERLGVPSEPVVPPVVLLLGVLGALVVANVAAAWPGARAARLSPAAVLRDE